MKTIVVALFFCFSCVNAAFAQEEMQEEEQSPSNEPLQIEEDQAPLKLFLDPLSDRASGRFSDPAYRDIITGGSVVAEPRSPRFMPRNSLENDRPAKTVADFKRQRQRIADRIADSIYPGFGRIESKNANFESRLDYISARRCGLKWGLCLQFKF